MNRFQKSTPARPVEGGCPSPRSGHLAFRYFVGALWLGIGASICAQTTSLPKQDAITGTNGSVIVGTLRSLDASGAKMDVILPSGGAGTINIAPSNMESIDFAAFPGEEDAMAATGAEALPKMRALFTRVERYLTVPNSRTGDIALRLAGLLLTTDKQVDWNESLTLIERVMAKDWDHARRQKARRVRLSALIKLGRAAEATAEARQLLEQADDEELLIEANWIIANSTFAELKELQKENPRWYQDERVKPRRAALYQEALDSFLYPSLFAFRNQESSARGLWGAVELYEFCEEADFAAKRAFDLVQLYPKSSFAPKAQELLKKYEDQKVPAPAPSPAETPAAEEAVAAPPTVTSTDIPAAAKPEEEMSEREKRRLKRREQEKSKSGETAPAP